MSDTENMVDFVKERDEILLQLKLGKIKIFLLERINNSLINNYDLTKVFICNMLDLLKRKYKNNIDAVNLIEGIKNACNYNKALLTNNIHNFNDYKILEDILYCVDICKNYDDGMYNNLKYYNPS